jgi:nucleotide-binding universal stress UspA family protein
MESNIRHILVPWDFTPSSEYALQHANQFAKIMNLAVSLLHIVEHKHDPNILAKLNDVAARNEKISGIHTKALIQEGEVLRTISELASLQDTALVVMKTDGIKGMQKYIGSRAIKIMRGSLSPFIVVQAPPQKELVQKIVYPIDFRNQSKELVSHIIGLIKTYNSPTKIYLLKAHTTDQRFKKNISNTVNFAKTLFETKHIEYEVATAKEGESYATSVNNFANTVKADLIVVQLQRNLTLSKFIFGVKEQGVIANPYRIPVMCINQRDLMVYAGFR